MFLDLGNNSTPWENVVNGKSFGLEHPLALSLPSVVILGKLSDPL